jgi:hypothetical protein
MNTKNQETETTPASKALPSSSGSDRTFDKAPIFSVRWMGLSKPSKMWLYKTRMANAGMCYFVFWQVMWRMPWLPDAAYSKGWDACFRQMYSKQVALEKRVEELSQND